MTTIEKLRKRMPDLHVSNIQLQEFLDLLYEVGVIDELEAQEQKPYPPGYVEALQEKLAEYMQKEAKKAFSDKPQAEGMHPTITATMVKERAKRPGMSMTLALQELQREAKDRLPKEPQTEAALEAWLRERHSHVCSSKAISSEHWVVHAQQGAEYLTTKHASKLIALCMAVAAVREAEAR